MKKILTVAAFAAAVAAGAISASTPAVAADASTQVSLCAAALDAQGIAALDAYRAKFVKSKGGSVQKIVLKLIPVESGESMEAECTIKRGEVLTAAIKA